MALGGRAYRSRSRADCGASWPWGRPASSLPADTEARLAGFTELVATAVADAQARTGVRSFGEEQAALRRVATLVARGAPPEEVFAVVTKEAGRLLTTDVAIMNGTPRTVPRQRRVWASNAYRLPLSAPGARRRAERDVAGVPDGPVRADRQQTDTSGPVGDIAIEVGIRASVGAPISVTGELWGVMIVASRTSRCPRVPRNGWPGSPSWPRPRSRMPRRRPR